MRIIGYSSAGFASNTDRISKLGQFVLLADDNNNTKTVAFKSYKSRRAVRPVLGAEIIVFSEMFDNMYA